MNNDSVLYFLYDHLFRNVQSTAQEKLSGKLLKTNEKIQPRPGLKIIKRRPLKFHGKKSTSLKHLGAGNARISSFTPAAQPQKKFYL